MSLDEDLPFFFMEKQANPPEVPENTRQNTPRFTVPW
ncbi:unnamed protein product [Brassica rapa subsp. trilocularis]